MKMIVENKIVYEIPLWSQPLGKYLGMTKKDGALFLTFQAPEENPMNEPLGGKLVPYETQKK